MDKTGLINDDTFVLSYACQSAHIPYARLVGEPYAVAQAQRWYTIKLDSKRFSDGVRKFRRHSKKHINTYLPITFINWGLTFIATSEMKLVGLFTNGWDFAMVAWKSDSQTTIQFWLVLVHEYRMILSRCILTERSEVHLSFITHSLVENVSHKNEIKFEWSDNFLHFPRHEKFITIWWLRTK